MSAAGDLRQDWNSPASRVPGFSQGARGGCLTSGLGVQAKVCSV